MPIHPTAIVDAQAEVDPTADIGPYSIVHADVVIGPGTRIGPHCVVHPGTRLGARNMVHAGVSLGDLPQSVGFDPAIPSRLEIGDDNTFREFANVHRSEREHGVTRIGNHGFFMTNCHLAHDCDIGDHVVLVSGSLVAGHAQLEDRVFLSGNCMVHQFCRVGTLAFFRGGAAVSMDVPPFAMVDAGNFLRGMNVVGLRRAGFSGETRRALHRAYKTLFYANLNVTQALEVLGDGPHDPKVEQLLAFVRASKRGVIRAHLGDHRPRVAGADAATPPVDEASE